MSDIEKNNMISGSATENKDLICKDRILVVDSYSERRRILASLVDKEFGEELSLQAESIETALKVITKNKVAFALVGLNSKEHNPYFAAEEIKLSNPAIAVLVVETDKFNEHNVLKDEANIFAILNTAVSERIMAGIRYVKSLTNCGLKGFTIVVKE